MSLVGVIVLVIVLGLIATFAPLEARFKNLLWGIAAAVVVIYLLLLLFGAVDFGGFPRGRVRVD